MKCFYPLVFYDRITYFQQVKTIVLLLQILLLIGCGSPEWQLKKVTGKRIAIDTVLPTKSNINALVAPYREKVAKEMSQVLCIAPKDITGKDGKFQSSLGNLLADLSYEMGNPVFEEKTKQTIDFVFMNAGGLRAPISKGKVTVQNAFSLMPFENDLVAVKMSGEKVKALFDYFIQKQRPHPLSKNVQVEINDEDYRVTIQGKAFNKNLSYWVLTNDYLQNGGDGMVFFQMPEALIGLDYKVRDAILDYFAQVDQLEASLDQRVIVQP